MNRAVFIDRDGTIARDVPYCSDPKDLHLLPGAIEGIRRLNDDQRSVVIVTNQSGIARGYFSEETLARIHEKMLTELRKGGAKVDAIYFCPHHPDEGCPCRKPEPGLLLRAASDLGLDVGQSYVIGDRYMDVEMGRKAGCKASLLVWREEERERLHVNYEVRVFPTFLKAVHWLTEHEKGEG